MLGPRFRQVLKSCYQVEAKWTGGWCFVLGFAQDEKFFSLFLKYRYPTNNSEKNTFLCKVLGKQYSAF